ncbi:MAG: peptidase M52 [Nocardioides sp.]|nr:peptidase M52 [Nocardioides sp.]
MLDDGFAPEPCDLLVVGCGNILRGDDAFGPVLVRTMYERGVPDGVRLVDGGTAGMDVAFGMRGAARVVLVDAAATGAEPGTLYRVPASELGPVPPLAGLHSHNFRWDHALALAGWLLGPHAPTDVTVVLCEAGALEPGEPLTPPVAAQVEVVADLLEREFYPRTPAADALAETVTLTAGGSLHVTAAQADRWFPGGVCVARLEGVDVLELLPLVDAGHGGLVLKQRNAAGDRAVLLSEVLGFRDDLAALAGDLPAAWDAERGVLRVTLGDADERLRGDDGGRGRAGAVGGLPAGERSDGSGTTPAVGAPERGARTSGGGRRTSDRDAAAGAETGSGRTDPGTGPGAGGWDAGSEPTGGRG